MTEILGSFDEIAPEQGEAIKFEVPGDRASGVVENARWVDNRFKDDGGPEKVFVIDLADDNGAVRPLFLRTRNLQAAIREAGKAVGAAGIAKGAYLEVEYTGDGEAKAGLNAPKLYKAVYAPSDAAWGGK